jgi:uncharacterized membrane protein YgcG
MKKILWSFLFTCAVFMSSAQAAERILSFHSDITVKPNAEMEVTETIRVNAEGQEIRHGIYRDFPTSYKGRWGEQVVVGFEVQEVTRDNHPEPFFLSHEKSNGVRVYIGRKKAMVSPGEHTYTITYVTNRQIGFFKDHDELYWNVNGNGWTFPADQVSASVELPSCASDAVKEIDAFVGAQGAKGKEFVSSRDGEGRVVFKTTRMLGPKEGMTILVTWPKGCIIEPAFMEKAGYFFKDNRSLIVGLAGLSVLLLFAFFMWVMVGMDPDKGTIIPLFYPPKGMSPAVVRHLMKMGFDDKVVACAVINMAVKGYLVIRKAKERSTTILEKTGQNEDKLSMDEAALARGFFKGSSKLELVSSSHERVREGIDLLKKQLSRDLEGVYFLTNQVFFLVLLGISILILATVIIVSGNDILGTTMLSLVVSGMIFLVLVLASKLKKDAGTIVNFVFMTAFTSIWVLMFIQTYSLGIMFTIAGVAVIDFVFYHLLKAPTLQGRKVMDQVDGFKMYLSVAEKDELKGMGAPVETQELFEQYLPYALALDVEQIWSERFSDLLASTVQEGQSYHPRWYHGTAWSTVAISASLANTISSSSNPPASRSGSGGGGHSGGGGGGGGGGGW